MKRNTRISFKKETLQRLLIVLFIFGFANTVNASTRALAKMAGLHKDKLERIVTKLVKVESTTGDYHVRNRKSGAYGRYQIMPKTASFYAKKLHIPFKKWKRPYNQDRIFQAIMKDNISSLKRNGYKISAFSIYATHQQGSRGFRMIMTNRPLDRKTERNLRRNLPDHLSKVRKSRLKRTWIHYWKERFV